MSSDTKQVLATSRLAFTEGEPEKALADLRALLRRPDTTPDTFLKAGRLLEKHGDVKGRPIRVRLFGECTLTWLKLALASTALRDGMRVSVTEAAYDNVIQEIASLSGSEVPDVAVLVPWGTRLLGPGSSASPEELVSVWEQAWSLLASVGCRRVVQVGYDWTKPGAEGYYLGAENGAVAQVREVNRVLRDRLPEGFAFFDIDTVSSAEGKYRFYDARRYHWTKQPYGDVGLLRFAEHLSAALRANFVGSKKVLVLDLDNTLWGGVVGEVGATGVAVSDGPEGEAFAAFQRFAKSLGERGVLLAVASKNNPEDAREPFENRHDMSLGLDDFVAFEASWAPKHKSVERLAAQLNLGLDSFVFFDDNPVEREEMRIHLPDVVVVDVPADPAYYIDAITESLLFETGKITDTDLKRASLYKDEAKRRDFQQRAASVKDYLQSLEMVATVEPVGKRNLSRVSQLLMRTNQFNLTNRRLSEDEVMAKCAHERSIGLALSLRDRFGDYGLVSVILASPDLNVDENTVRVGAWVMSCRVMGRGVEHHFFQHLVNQAKLAGFCSIHGEFMPSKKNSPVAGLYDKYGMAAIGLVAEAGTLYAGKIESIRVPENFITLAIS